MKRILSLVLALILVLSLAACSDNGANGTTPQDPTKPSGGTSISTGTEESKNFKFPSDIPAKKVGVMGGSQGGALTMACIGLVPEINRAAPVYPFLSDYKRVWDMDMDMRAYAEMRTFFRHHDPRHEREDEIFMKLGYIDIANLAPRKMKGIMSEGMILAAEDENGTLSLVTPEKDIASGTRLG